MTTELVTEHVEQVRSKKRPGSVRYWRDAERTELVSGTCRTCGTLTPAVELVRDRTKPGGRQIWCRYCLATYDATRHATPERQQYLAARDRRRVASGENAAEIARRRARLRARTADEIALDRARLRPDGVKPCRSCSATLALSEFGVDVNQSDGLRNSCRPCHNAAVARRADKAIAALAPFVEDRDNYRCYLCDRPATALGIPYHQEHSYPEALGGSSHPANLHWACADCNMSKQDRYVTDWARYDDGELTYPYAAAVADYVVEERLLPAKKDLARMTPRSSTPGPNGLPARVLAMASPEAVAAALREEADPA